MIPRWHSLIIGVVSLALGLYLMTFVGCVPYIPQSSTIQTGQEVSAPAGWSDYCIRHPEDPSCKETK